MQSQQQQQLFTSPCTLLSVLPSHPLLPFPPLPNLTLPRTHVESGISSSVPVSAVKFKYSM